MELAPWIQEVPQGLPPYLGKGLPDDVRHVLVGVPPGQVDAVELSEDLRPVGAIICKLHRIWEGMIVGGIPKYKRWVGIASAQTVKAFFILSACEQRGALSPMSAHNCWTHCKTTAAALGVLCICDIV